MDGRMVKSWFRLDTLPNPQIPANYQSYEATETYRYDALGRRIWTRMIRGKNCENKDKSSGCRSTITRTVWDGDHILHEVRAPGTDTTYVDLEYDGPGNAFHGVVTYTHGKVIDQPLAVMKDGGVIHPLTNARGVISHGTCPETACSQLSIWFPAGSALLYGGGATRPTGPPSWNGSLIEDQQDGSGYQYRRNRYYDPSTGRFTQEDPIGIAGGLNTYGYAEGDPVNFSDPFGLCPDPTNPKCTSGTVTYTLSLGGTAAAFFMGLNGQAGLAVDNKLNYTLFGQAGYSAGFALNGGPQLGVQKGSLNDLLSPTGKGGGISWTGSAAAISGGINVSDDSKISGGTIGLRGPVGATLNTTFGGLSLPPLNLMEGYHKVKDDFTRAAIEALRAMKPMPK